MLIGNVLALFNAYDASKMVLTFVNEQILRLVFFLLLAEEAQYKHKRLIWAEEGFC
jgi:hypothetical protein